MGKQDQYASSFGGFNIFKFRKNDVVQVEPLYVDYKIRTDLNKHSLLFYTGISRHASIVLKEQKQKTKNKLDSIKKMTELVNPFKENLLKGNYQQLGKLLHNNWLMKRELASKISNKEIDKIYNIATENGAWGGKVLGAGAGGCILFLSPLNKKNAIRKKLFKLANELELEEFKEIPFNFIQSGANYVTNHQGAV
jgi:D-glycero-alpha-D-manno-heptose-7-phosphate kinase